MPPRCAAVRTRIGLAPGPPPSSDGVWITDTMLREAIERYNRISSQSRHSLSSCPGPIESRRRLGKRHMTAIMPGSHFTPPPWSIEFPLRLDEWKWEPPNTPEDRIRNNKRFSLSRLLNRSIEWLENFDDGVSTRDLGAQSSTAEVVTVHQFTGMQTAVLSGDVLDEILITATNLELISAEMDGSGLFDTEMAYTETIDLAQIYATACCTDEMVKLNKRLGALDLTQTTDGSLWKACKPFAEYLQFAIPQKQVSGSDLRAALQPFTAATKLRLGGEVLAAAEARVRNLILRVLQESDQMHIYPNSFWLSSMALLKTMDKHQIATYLYFSRLAKAAQTTGKGWLRHSIILDTITYAIEFLAALPAHHKHITKYNTIIITGVKNLGKVRPALMWERVLDLLAQRHSGEELKKFQRQTSLLMSFDSHAQTSKCLDAYAGAWNSEDSFLFTKGRLWSTNCLPTESIHSFLHLPITDANWSRLVSHISATTSQKRALLFQHLCQATKKTGQFRMMTEHLIEHMGWNRDGDARTLREIAIAIRDYKQALNLWRMANVWLGPGYITGQWDWTAWVPYMESIIKDPSVGDSIIWRVLAMRRGLSNQVCPGAKLNGISTETELLESMGKWFLEANHLNNSQILRRITKCISTYQRINKSLSPQILLCLVEVVLRDFEHEHRWSEEKIRWMKELIKQNMGEEQANRVVTQLQGWQWTIRNRDFKQTEPTAERIQREPDRATRESDNSNHETIDGLKSPRGLNTGSVEAFNNTKILSKNISLDAMKQHQVWRQGGQISAKFMMPEGNAARESWNRGWIPWRILQRRKHAAQMMAMAEMEDAEERNGKQCKEQSLESGWLQH